MVVPHPHRPPFLVKTSSFDTEAAPSAWSAGLLDCSAGRRQTINSRYFGAAFRLPVGEIINDRITTNQFEWREITMMLAAGREYRPRCSSTSAPISVSTPASSAGADWCRGSSHSSRIATILHDTSRTSRAQFADGHRPSLPVCRRRRTWQSHYELPARPTMRGLSKIDRTGSGRYSVDVVALDDEVDIRGSAILIKIDVEDYELEVLAGAARLPWKQRRIRADRRPWR